MEGGKLPWPLEKGVEKRKNGGKEKRKSKVCPVICCVHPTQPVRGHCEDGLEVPVVPQILCPPTLAG